jgi:hypothetical protein
VRGEEISRYLNLHSLPRIIVFIGDSHVVSLTDSKYKSSINCKFERTGKRYVLYLSLWFKDTLAYQVSKKLYSKNLAGKAYLLGLLRIFGARYFFSFGEIDIRCHLAKKDKFADFLSLYVLFCKELVNADSDRIFFLTPTPPSDLYENHPNFPRFGDISERMEAYNEFCKNLAIAASQQSSKFIDLSDQLLSMSYGLRADLTNDGCHLNQKGATLVRKKVLSED